MLHIRDLVDLARRLAVAARSLVRIGDRLAGNLGELAAHLAKHGLLRHDVTELDADPVRSSFKAGELGAHLEAFGKGRGDVGHDRR